MIEIIDLHKRFDDNHVLNGVNLTISEGETHAIIGRSGCGKSVMLKHIVGLLVPDKGCVKMEGKVVHELAPDELYELRQEFGFLFQGAALFDSMTVEENVSLPLIEGKTKFTEAEIKDTVDEKLELVGLPGIRDLKPAELSGGMKKRVGLARALVMNPRYILYDEPTTGLDPMMSDAIDDLIKELADKLNSTAIIVTHDMASVKNVADRISMMHEGEVYFTGTPDDLLNHTDSIVADFVKRTGKHA